MPYSAKAWAGGIRRDPDLGRTHYMVGVFSLVFTVKDSVKYIKE